ncbi:MAG TPA: MFS transporter [Gaiellaceae bacterium]|nr:MFS transporter [Gaiellaceae bacterium]
MTLLRRYLRTLNPPLPGSVRTLQAGALVNALGNGLAYPFLFIYLHNVRDIDLATAGLIVGTNSAVGLVAGPIVGSFIDRVGGRVTLAFSLWLMTIGFGAYAFVEHPWQGFLASAIAGIGNGGFWPSQSSLIAGLTPPEQRHQAFAMQRVMMNLGIGLGGLAGGLIATTANPTTFQVLFLGDAATFVLYSVVLIRVPSPARQPRPEGRERGGYAEVVRNRIFMAVVGLNVVFIGAGMAQLETLPVYAKNEAGVTERGIGVLFFLNTLVVVLAQLPAARLLEGHRRMRTLALLGVVWAAGLLLVPVAGVAVDGTTAAALLAVTFAVIAVGECLHGTVQAPLVADLADHSLIGRYMAASAFSWGVGFAVGPALGGVVLNHAPHLLWPAAAAVCLVAGAAALGLERAIPVRARTTPRREQPPAAEIPRKAAPRVESVR